MTAPAEPDVVEINLRIDRMVARRVLARPEHERAVLNLIAIGAMHQALIELEHATGDSDDDRDQ